MINFNINYPIPFNLSTIFTTSEVRELQETFKTFEKDNGQGYIEANKFFDIVGLLGKIVKNFIGNVFKRRTLYNRLNLCC